jgi:hypothetical protein
MEKTATEGILMSEAIERRETENIGATETIDGTEVTTETIEGNGG